MEDDDSSDDERPAVAPASNGTSTRVLSDEKVHSYSLLLAGNLLDFGQDVDASHVCEIPIQADAPITQVSCGLDWLLLLTASGRAYSCGLNAYGQLGQGPSQKQHQQQQQQVALTNAVSLVPKPLLFPVDKKIARISCGASHGGFVVENGALFMFGCSSYGRLGIGDTAHQQHQHTPTQVRMTWSALQAKVAATKVAVNCGIPVIHQNLKLSVEPSSSAVGNAAIATPVAPQVPQTDENQQDGETDDNDGDEVVFADISCGDRHTLALGAKASSITAGSSSNPNSVKNSIIAFGDGMNGRLGIGSESDQLTGALVTVLKAAPQFSKGGGGLQPKITSISAGVSHNAALSSSGELFTWGNGADGQLGHGSCESEWVPRQVDFFKSISLASVKCGARHTLAVSRTGAVYTWGRGVEGQLGTGLAGLRDPQEVQERQGGPAIGWKPEKVSLVIDPLAIQQMNIDAQVQAAFAATSGGGSSSGSGAGAAGGGTSAGSASQQQLQQQDFRITVRSIVAKANVCMALDEHARLFTWGSNRDRQLGFPLNSNDGEEQLQSRPRPKCPPEKDTLCKTTTAASWIVPKPKQLMYMDLEETTRRPTSSAGASSSRVTTIRDQVHAMATTNASGFARQSLAHVDASERFSLLVFKTEPKLTGGLRGALSRNSSVLGSGGGIGSIGEEGSLVTGIAEYEGGNPTAPSFPNRSQMRLLVHHQQRQQSKGVEPLARDGVRSKKSVQPGGSKWQFSLLHELRTEDMPSKESEYYNLMVNYKVHIRKHRAPGGAETSTVAFERTSTRQLLGFVECDYDIGGMSSISSNSNNNNNSDRDENAPGGCRVSQRVVMARRAASANNSGASRAQDKVGSATAVVEASHSTLSTSSPGQVRGFDGWLKTRSPQASPKKVLYGFGTSLRFQERASSSGKEDQERSPVSATKARMTSPRTQSRVHHRNDPAGPEPPVSELPRRPKSAFGRTLHTAFSTRKMAFTSGAGSAATSNIINNNNNAPQQQASHNRLNPTRATLIPATPVKAKAAAAPPQRPKTARAASVNARSRNHASLQLQLHKQERALHRGHKQQANGLFAVFGSSSKSRFGPESPPNSFKATCGCASPPLHPEKSTPLVYPASPGFSMGSGEDFSLVVARRLARARGAIPGPGTYDRHGG